VNLHRKCITPVFRRPNKLIGRMDRDYLQKFLARTSSYNPIQGSKVGG